MKGTVVLSLVVTAKGDAADIKVARALGSLDQKAIEAVSPWKFEPATKMESPAVKVAVESASLYRMTALADAVPVLGIPN